jgi:serine/threonine protein kinase
LKQTVEIPKLEIPEVTIHKVHYKTNKILGSGLNALIYLATDTTHNRLIALKAIEFIKDDPAQVDLVERELKCLQRLQKNCDEFVLCYIDSDLVTIKQEDGSVKNYYIIITKFLENYITWNIFKKKYPEHRKEAAKNLKLAFQHIHDQKIYHGDIHDDNIMVDPETLNVKVIDFGYCKVDPDPIFYEYDLSNLESYYKNV